MAGFRFDFDKASIAFDPFVTRPGVLRVLFGRPRCARELVARRYGGVDAVFVGHAHYDHAMDLPAVARASPHALFYGGPQTIALCLSIGVPAERTVAVEDGQRLEVGPFRVEAVASAHGRVPLLGLIDRPRRRRPGPPPTPLLFPRGDVLAWRVEVGGRTFHIQGSAGIAEASLARQAPVDALLPCLAARRDTPGYLVRLGERLRPGVLVPCHHDDFFRPLTEPPRPGALLDWQAFLADADRLRTAYGTVLWCPPRDVGASW